MTQAESLLRELIALPSVNPAFVPANDPRAGEKRVAAFLAATAAQAGLDAALQEGFPNRANVIIRLLPPGRIRQRIELAPHMDAVGVVSTEQFIAVLKNGRRYGRCACDTKASIAVMLAALLELAAAPKRPAVTEIVLVALVDEENGQTGSRFLVRSGLKADLAIV